VPSERLLTPAFLLVAAATLAYYIAGGIVLPITPRYAEGPLGADPVQVGLVVGAFSVTAIVLRPWETKRSKKVSTSRSRPFGTISQSRMESISSSVIYGVDWMDLPLGIKYLDVVIFNDVL
jgi:hypothetical protein